MQSSLQCGLVGSCSDLAPEDRQGKQSTPPCLTGPWAVLLYSSLFSPTLFSLLGS